MLGRRLLAGFLAGASSLVGLLAILMLVLFGGGLISLLHELSINQTIQVHGNITFWGAIGRSFAETFKAMPTYFWSARWGILVLGVLGLVLGAIDHFRGRVHRPWRDNVGFIATMGVVGATVFALQFANSDALYGWVADSPELFSQQAAVLVSDTTLVLTATLVALAMAYIVWAAWHSWYVRWSSWLHLSPAIVAGPFAKMPQHSEWQEYQERQRRLKEDTNERVPERTPAVAASKYRSFFPAALIGLVIISVLAYGLLSLYHRVSAGITTYQIWVTQQTPNVVADMSFPKAPQLLTLSNTGGKGLASAMLSAASGGQDVRRLDKVEFANTATSFKTSSLDLHGLKAGDYHLNLKLQSGEGGMMQVVGLFGGGPDAYLAAIVFGIAAGLWFVAAAVAWLEFLTQIGRYRNLAA